MGTRLWLSPNRFESFVVSTTEVQDKEEVNAIAQSMPHNMLTPDYLRELIRRFTEARRDRVMVVDSSMSVR